MLFSGRSGLRPDDGGTEWVRSEWKTKDAHATGISVAAAARTTRVPRVPVACAAQRRNSTASLCGPGRAAGSNASMDLSSNLSRDGTRSEEHTSELQSR